MTPGLRLVDRLRGRGLADLADRLSGRLLQGAARLADRWRGRLLQGAARLADRPRFGC